MGKAPKITGKLLSEYIKGHENKEDEHYEFSGDPGITLDDGHIHHLSSIDNIVQESLLSLNDNELDEVIRSQQRVVPLSRLIRPAFINPSLKAETKQNVLSAMAMKAYQLGLATGIDGLYSQLIEREKTMSTAVGEGVAIPHVKMPSSYIFRRSGILLACSKSGVVFDDDSKRKVYLFFMPCAQNEFVHLRFMAHIAKLVHDEKVRSRLVCASTKEEMHHIISAFDRHKNGE